MKPPFEQAANLARHQKFRHGFFGREGGVSTGLYDSLNVGPGSGDDATAVATNRDIVQQTLQAEILFSCHQIHSPDVVHVTGPWNTRPKADAMVTDQPGFALCILTADCTPVLFADPEAGIIGAAHAGWKGALAGVLDATIARMIEMGADPGRISAAIGPTIQQASYEVGPEFREAFLAADASCEDLFIPGKGDRLHFDLPAFCRRRLVRAGIDSIIDLGLDTCALTDKYFSNRRRNHRGESDYGRNASVIVISN